MTRGPARVLFMGSKAIGLRILREMHGLAQATLAGAVTIDDRTDGRSAYADFVAFCDSCAVPLSVARSRGHADEVVASIQPDLCIVVGWYWLIPASTLSTVPRGFVGVHNSTLPAYRGGAPLVWQMINGEPRAGFSIFRLTAGMDDGPVWAAGSVSIEAGDYVGDVLVKLEHASVAAFREVFPRLLDNRAEPIPQAAGGESYCTQRRPADGMIDWTLPAPRIFDFIRAQSDPYPGAFTTLAGRKMTVWRAAPFAAPYFGVAGQVARVTPEGVVIICGHGTALTLTEVELDGVRSAAVAVLPSNATCLGSA